MNDSPPHLRLNLHFNLQIKMPKRKSRSEMGLLNTLQNTHDSSFTWKDGTAVDYENWNDYEPNNSGGMEGCVTIDDWSSKIHATF